MILPADTKFPSCGCDLSEMLVDWDLDDAVTFSFGDSESGYESVMLDRSQVESLRDQLTAWLEATRDAG